MQFLTVRGCTFGGLLLLASLPLGAQSPHYHLELTYQATPQPITRITFVNDSTQPIEAFYVLEICEQGAYAASADRMNVDALDAPGGASAVHRSNGRTSRVIGLEPGGRWAAGSLNKWDVGSLSGKMSGRGGHDCKPQIAAVIYADGSYEGKKTFARGLKARRDGIAASLNYWIQKLDGATLGSLLAESEHRDTEDEDKAATYYSTYDGSGRGAEPLSLEYWEGRRQVDLGLKTWVNEAMRGQRYAPQSQEELSNRKALEALKGIADRVQEWKTELDNDVAMRKLNTIFKPIRE